MRTKPVINALAPIRPTSSATTARYGLAKAAMLSTAIAAAMMPLARTNAGLTLAITSCASVLSRFQPGSVGQSRKRQPFSSGGTAVSSPALQCRLCFPRKRPVPDGTTFGPIQRRIDCGFKPQFSIEKQPKLQIVQNGLDQGYSSYPPHFVSLPTQRSQTSLPHEISVNLRTLVVRKTKLQ